MTSDVQFRKVLEAMSKFHHYSANNVLLIAMQMPEATRVASYTTWKTKFCRNSARICRTVNWSPCRRLFYWSLPA